jgi:predicted nucleotidyltransferase
MKSAETADISDTLPLDTILSVLRDHPVRLAILFGSYATGTDHPRSDIDIAVELNELILSVVTIYHRIHLVPR